LEVIRQLKEHIPLERAKMLVQITVPRSDAEEAESIRSALAGFGAIIAKDTLMSQSPVSRGSMKKKE
jgi:hypothetical protein